MRSLLLVVVGAVGFLTVSALAQNPPAITPVRVAGTIEKLDGDNLTVKTKEGQAVTVTLITTAAIFGVEKRSVADIKPGDYLASGGVKGSDGKIHATEVRIFSRGLAWHRRRAASVGRQAGWSDDQRHSRQGHPIDGGRCGPCQL